MSTQKRPQNRCKSCHYTWYPRGKDVSYMCPRCGSTDVTVVFPWGALVTIAVIFYIVFHFITR